MDLGIAGRKAIVCGSSRGLGKACATSLARAGCVVVVNGINPERLAETAGEIVHAVLARPPFEVPGERGEAPKQAVVHERDTHFQAVRHARPIRVAKKLNKPF